MTGLFVIAAVILFILYIIGGMMQDSEKVEKEKESKMSAVELKKYKDKKESTDIFKYFIIAAVVFGGYKIFM